MKVEGKQVKETKKEEKATKRTDLEGIKKKETKMFQMPLRVVTASSGLSRGF
jgi:hypothetical protein